MLSGAVKQQIGNVSLPRPPSAIQEQPLLRSQCTPPGLQKMLLWWLQLFLTASLILTTHAVSKGLIKLDPPHCFLQSTAGGALSSGTADELRHAKSPGSAPVYFPYMSSPLPSNLLIPKWLLSQPRAEIWMTEHHCSELWPCIYHVWCCSKGHVKLPFCATRNSSSLWEGMVKALGIAASPPPLRLPAKAWTAQGNPSLLVTEREKTKSVLTTFVSRNDAFFWTKVYWCFDLSVTWHN